MEHGTARLRERPLTLTRALKDGSWEAGMAHQLGGDLLSEDCPYPGPSSRRVWEDLRELQLAPEPRPGLGAYPGRVRMARPGPREPRGPGRLGRRADPCEQSLADHDVVRKVSQVHGVHDDAVLPEDVAEIGPMRLFRVLLGETVGRLVGADDRARILLDVLDRRQGPDVRLLLSPGISVGGLVRREGDERGGGPAAVIQKQHPPPIQEHGLVPGRHGHLARIGNLLGEIDEGHEARD